MGNYNLKQFIQIIGGLLIALFIIIELVSGHFGQLDAKLLWEDFGTCMSVVLIITFCFDRWLWRLPVFQKWLVPFPCLAGEWEGHIFYNWDGIDMDKFLAKVRGYRKKMDEKIKEKKEQIKMEEEEYEDNDDEDDWIENKNLKEEN